MSELKNMKALRYLLIVMAVLSVVSVQAATLGTPYQPQTRGIRYTSYHSQMPVVAMNSTAPAMMSSGSSLPMAAVSGVYVTGATPESSSPVTKHPGHVRRGMGDDETTEDDPDPQKPSEPSPLGDVLWPLMLMAMAYVVYRRKRTKKASA